MSFLLDIDYQPVVDTLVRVGPQLNKPALRFLKGEVIALALEKATGGRLKYVDEEGYDSVDQTLGTKYEFKSTVEMFRGNEVVGRVSLSNTNKDSFRETFDYLLLIQSNPERFALAQMTWAECNNNLVAKSGQFNLAKGVHVSNWICQNKTTCNVLPPVKLDVRRLLETVL
jgi:hypothetical protein